MAHEIDSDTRPTVRKHVIHYPLNGLGLDFLRYSPPRFGPKSVLASRIFQDYLFPKRLTPETYSKRKWLPKANVKGSLGSFEMLDSGLYREYITLDNLKTRSLLWEARFSRFNFSRFNNQPCSRDNLATAVRLEDITQDILQRFFLESESETLHEVLSIHAKMNQFDARGNRSPRVRRSWAMLDARDFPRLQWLEDDYKLYPGPSTQSHASIYLNSIDSALSIGGDTDLLVRPALCTSKRHFRACPFPPFPRWPRRERSLPPLRGYRTAAVTVARTHSGDQENVTWLLSWPGLSLQELDHRTRPRSLSRRRIARMFEQDARPQLNFRADGARKTSTGPRCSNCMRGGHTREDCNVPCGHCNSRDHGAEDCGLPKGKRCKCSQFPTLHRARDCHVMCSRPCGNPYPAGHRQHLNAMMCKHRCCMCGLKGHSGMDCNLKRCRCKGQHLGQDCSWNPVCRVKGCDRYLCGVHCRECGSTERPFVGWRCQGCLRNGAPVGGRADANGQDASHVEEAREL